MKDSFYLHDRTVVVNFTNQYYRTAEELISGPGFSKFLEAFLKQLAIEDIEVYEWVVNKQSLSDYIPRLVLICKMLMVLTTDEVNSPMLHSFNSMKLLTLIEKAYNYWRKLERFSIVNTASSQSLQFAGFIDADQDFNNLVLSVYRTLEEKVQGRKNNLYRQMSAGTNGSILLRPYKWPMPNEYHVLKGIPFVHTVMVRSPLLLYPRCNKREGMFSEIFENPIHSFTRDKNCWMCYPAKVGSLLIYIYFHQDFISGGISLSNLFELASEQECMTRKPDGIVLFGNQDNKDETTYYYDSENDIWVGNVSYNQKIEYFGYLKKMTLTLHNIAKMKKGWLPIHGAMVNVYLRDGSVTGVVMIGDSGAGKSETIEAVKGLGNQDIARVDVVFDDMGSFHIEDGKVYAQGTETGAFVRLDDLDKGTAYRDMERSIFMNPESSNARVVLPASSYNLITTNHQIDMVLYANNYEDKRGMHQFANLEEAKNVFIQGKRMALGTTQEKGLSTTYFANPFGPMQHQDICDGIFDSVFNCLKDNNVFIGEIYTCLGLSKDKDGLQIGAQELLEHMKGHK